MDQTPFKVSETFNDEESQVKFDDLENFFNVYQDKYNYFYCNLNSTIYVSIPSNRLKTYVCQHDIHWPTISYNLYGTVRLAWLLMKINNITPTISFKIVPAGSEVKYLDRSDLATVIDNLKE